MMKRIALLLVIFLIAGIYLFTRKPQAGHISAPKQILGEQEQIQDQPQFETYKIKKGDTLFNLSQRHNLSWQVLAEINGLKEPYTLKIGQEIKIPVSKR